MDLSASDVRAVEFSTAKRKGYDGGEVDEFLDRVARTLFAYEERLRQVDEQVREYAKMVEETKGRSGAAEELIIMAQHRANEVLSEAERKAHAKIDEAEKKLGQANSFVEERAKQAAAEARRRGQELVDHAERRAVEIEKEMKRRYDEYEAQVVLVRKQTQSRIDTLQDFEKGYRESLKARFEQYLQLVEHPGELPSLDAGEEIFPVAPPAMPYTNRLAAQARTKGETGPSQPQSQSQTSGPVPSPAGPRRAEYPVNAAPAGALGNESFQQSIPAGSSRPAVGVTTAMPAHPPVPGQVQGMPPGQSPGGTGPQVIAPPGGSARPGTSIATPPPMPQVTPPPQQQGVARPMGAGPSQSQQSSELSGAGNPDKTEISPGPRPMGDISGQGPGNLAATPSSRNEKTIGPIPAPAVSPPSSSDAQMAKKPGGESGTNGHIPQEDGGSGLFQRLIKRDEL